MKRIVLAIFAVAVALSVSAEELNVASINIRVGRHIRKDGVRKGDYKKFNGWDDRKQYLCDMINLEAFDLFGAQEVQKVQLDDMLAMLPDYDYIGVGADDGVFKGEICPVFYRKDAVEKLDGGTFWFSPTPDVPSKGWDAKYQRICTWGLFRQKATGKKVCFMNIHLDHIGQQARLESAKQLVAYVKKHCKGASVVIVGDYNVSQTSESYQYFASSKILKDTYEAAKYRFAPTGTFNGFNPRRYTTHRIDHIFVSKRLKVSRHGVLTYHYFRDMKAQEEAMETAAPKEIKGENRDTKCLTDHYVVQAFVTLK